MAHLHGTFEQLLVDHVVERVSYVPNVQNTTHKIRGSVASNDSYSVDSAATDARQLTSHVADGYFFPVGRPVYRQLVQLLQLISMYDTQCQNGQGSLVRFAVLNHFSLYRFNMSRTDLWPADMKMFQKSDLQGVSWHGCTERVDKKKLSRNPSFTASHLPSQLHLIDQ